MMTVWARFKLKLLILWLGGTGQNTDWKKHSSNYHQYKFSWIYECLSWQFWTSSGPATHLSKGQGDTMTYISKVKLGLTKFCFATFSQNLFTCPLVTNQYLPPELHSNTPYNLQITDFVSYTALYIQQASRCSQIRGLLRSIKEEFFFLRDNFNNQHGGGLSR